MDHTINNLVRIEKEIQLKIPKSKTNPVIVAVSKTFPMTDILPLINHGHIHFGENKIQEAVEKWTDIKNDFPHIQLHMSGKLQTNKVKYVIPLFDYIHSLDNLKLAEKISKEQIKYKKHIKIFIQVNIGQEPQKSGVQIDDLDNFYEICSLKLGLKVVGLMCLPPDNMDASPYFTKIKFLKDKLNLKDLSIGMSNDYLEAIEHDSTFLRIGSKIFGQRD